jgi:DNA (cytosine-5)-methyltransferase 1
MVSNRTKKYAQGGTPLTLAVKMWPTPRAAIGMNMRLTENMAKLRHKKYLETEVAYQESAPGGQLNPTWVEWLMGYPTGWTVSNA